MPLFMPNRRRGRAAAGGLDAWLGLDTLALRWCVCMSDYRLVWCVCVCSGRDRAGGRGVGGRRGWDPLSDVLPLTLTHPTHSPASPRPPAGCVGMEVAGLPGTVPFLFSFSSLFFFFLHFSACMGACAKRSVRDGDARAWRAPGSGVRARV